MTASVTAGIDVGSSAVKAAVVRIEDGGETLLGRGLARVRKREVAGW